jgi:hypothetical protein
MCSVLRLQNMLAIECSNPIATNVMMLSHIPAIFPIVSSALIAHHMAMQTSQLQATPFSSTAPQP